MAWVKRVIECPDQEHKILTQPSPKPGLLHQGPVFQKAASSNPGLRNQFILDSSLDLGYIRTYILRGFTIVYINKTEGKKYKFFKLSAKQQNLI